MAGVGLPHAAVREQVASALDVVVHQARLPGGARVVESVTEVVRVAGGAGTRELYTARRAAAAAARRRPRSGSRAGAPWDRGWRRRAGPWSARWPSSPPPPRCSAACTWPRRGCAAAASGARGWRRCRARRRSGPGGPRGPGPWRVGAARSCSPVPWLRSAPARLCRVRRRGWRSGRPVPAPSRASGRARERYRRAVDSGAPRWRWRWRTPLAAAVRCAPRCRGGRVAAAGAAGHELRRVAAELAAGRPPTTPSRPCAGADGRRGGRVRGGLPASEARGRRPRPLLRDCARASRTRHGSRTSSGPPPRRRASPG